MSTAKETPLGINVQSAYAQNCGLTINPDAAAHMGESKVNGQYTFGSIVNDSCLFWLTWAIHDAYCRGVVYTSPAGTSTYDNLIKIGQGVCEALGNAKPPTYNDQDPSDAQIPPDTPTWYHENHPATTGYAISGVGYSSAGSYVPINIAGQGQHANWYPYDMTNPNNSITQWGFVRCWALQAWNEFNWNGGVTDPEPLRASSGTPLSPVQYKDFLSSFMTCSSFIDYTNVSIDLLVNAPTYLKGTYSNMNDLDSADITGVNLATAAFGRDCIAAGKVIDLSQIAKFGLPSVLLQTIQKCHAVSQALNLALLSAGLSPDEIALIANNALPSVSKEQEQLIYGACLVIVGTDLQDILIPMNCKTPGLTCLADLLDIRKLFPNSYQSMTVPIYNKQLGLPTNSKTYYPIFEGNGVSPRLINPSIADQVGTIVPAGDPPIEPKSTSLAVETKPAITTSTPSNPAPVIAATPAVAPAPVVAAPAPATISSSGKASISSGRLSQNAATKEL